MAQQIQTIQRQERNAPERRAADSLLRELLRRDEDLRRRLAGGAGDPPLP